MRNPTSAQLRSAIDKGLTGDKVAAPDPAAAPLGTDEEAAGTPLHGQDVSAALTSELRTGDLPARTALRAPVYAWLLVGVILAIAGVILHALGLLDLR